MSESVAENLKKLKTELENRSRSELKLDVQKTSLPPNQQKQAEKPHRNT